MSASTIKVENLSTGRWIWARVRYAPASHVATVTPKANLLRGTRYRVAILTGIKDQSNNRLLSVRWTFRTRP